MVGCTRRPGKRAKIRFADPPWNERSDEWQIRDRQVPADHPARAVVEAMKHLNLTPLFDLYFGTGSPPTRPDLMLAIVLIEIRLGRPQPCQWFCDTRENMVIQWAGFGIRPSRTCWYDFADRIAPLLEQWNAAVLQLARQRGVTQAERMSLDGTSVAANASRHRLLNETTVGQRLTELGSACRADATAQPPENVPTCPNRGRAVKRSEHEALVEAHRARMVTAEAKTLYRLRCQTVELGFAYFKQHRSMRQFSGRGRCRAQRQVGLTVLVHNLLIVQRAKPPPQNKMDTMLTTEEITT